MRAAAAAAVAGAVTVAAVYGAARRLGLTRVDLAARLAPGHPVRGRLLQLAAGTAACLPAAATGSARRGALAGLSAAVLPAKQARRRRDAAVAFVAHAAGGAVAGHLARR
jgi:hypothetical protein